VEQEDEASTIAAKLFKKPDLLKAVCQNLTELH
jgi:hypothetical protein